MIGMCDLAMHTDTALSVTLNWGSDSMFYAYTRQRSLEIGIIWQNSMENRVVNRYMNAAKVGEDVLITAQVLKQGRTLAFATVDLTNKSTGKLIAQGRHTKHLGSG